jgi:hypothetical protein
MMPQVVARHDTVHVIWEQTLQDSKISYLQSTDNGETWGNVINLNEPGYIYCNYANLALTDNDIWVSWADNGNESIALTSSTNGSSWSSPIYKFTFDSQRFEYLSMSASVDTIFFAYKSQIRDSLGLAPYRFLRTPDGGHTWSNLFTIGYTHSGILSMELNHCQGDLLITVASAPDTALSGYHIIGYASSNSGQTWSDTMWISPRQWYTAQQPCLSCNNSSGQIAVGYMDYRYQQYAFYGDIFIRLSDPDPHQWGYEAQASNNHTAVSPAISFSETTICAVWSDRQYNAMGYDQLTFNRSYNMGESWEGEERLTNTPDNSWDPDIFYYDGKVYLVWYEELSGSSHGSDIYFMKYTPDSSDIIGTDTPIPSPFQISANPNPFNSAVSINIKADQPGTLNISDLLGRFVTELNFPKGASTIKWDATDKVGKAIRSGAYFLKPKGGSYRDIIKVMYLK